MDDSDRLPWLTLGSVLALGAAVAMARAGLPPLDLHGPLHQFGIMDPLCGGTRAARFAARGNLIAAWQYNPLSVVIVYGAALVLVRGLVGLITRRWVTPVAAWTPKLRRWAFLLGVVLLIVLEVRQQFRADLLMAGT